jgi:predicted ATPase
MKLIERESQLAALHQYADEASHAQGRLVLVSGEAGIGKSALVEDFAQQSADARWLWAGCDGLFTPAALGPLLDIASQLGGELLRLCHADAKRDQLYSALLGQLSDLGTLTVIAVEDIHWADEATLDLLSHLGRRIQHLPVLLVVTYRDDALCRMIHCGSPWAGWQANERPAGSACHLSPQPALQHWRMARRSTQPSCIG